MENAPSSVSRPHENRHIWPKTLAVIILLLLLAAAGWLAWQLKQCKDEDKKTTVTNTQLEQKVASLNKQLVTTKATASNSASTSSAACAVTSIPQSLKDNMADAVKSKNYAALAGYMASPVTVVIAASEKGGSESPAQAVADMAYLSGATDPWNFALPSGTTDVWAAHFYKQYFTGMFYTGEAASHHVVSLQVDSCGKISSVFMAADATLLE
ncbi:MAG TPA: hypothetical protein VLH38_04325 [Patescibacteria group bacterium]|nr:hypothetical protein [Patescibacteria group bacterium]